jgi:hypothetical protein
VNVGPEYSPGSLFLYNAVKLRGQRAIASGWHAQQPLLVAPPKMEDLRPLSYGVITALFSLATITILMRIYVRWYTMNAFGWDDLAMSSMLVRMNDNRVA